MTARPRIAFFGTPAFAVPTLARLLARADVDVAWVVCQPDRPAGRGQQLAPPPVKVAALAAGVPVMQPTKLRDGALAATLRSGGTELGVVVAYGRILPADLLSAPRQGCVNLHASLLPRWRGAAPIQRAIAAGDATTGVCLMQMDEGLDTGAVLARCSRAIGPAEDAPSLALGLADDSAALLDENLTALLSGSLTPVPQAAEGVCWAQPLRKEEGAIDWAAPAAALHARLRALVPWPGSYFVRGTETWKTYPDESSWTTNAPPGNGAVPGTVLAIDGERVLVQAGEGALWLRWLQRPGRPRAGAGSVLRGARVAVGDHLGP